MGIPPSYFHQQWGPTAFKATSKPTSNSHSKFLLSTVNSWARTIPSPRKPDGQSPYCFSRSPLAPTSSAWVP